MELIILIISAFMTSSISAVIGMGGGIILLGIMAILIPEGYLEVTIDNDSKKSKKEILYPSNPGSVYLIRPDQYIAARWKDSPPLKEIKCALEKAMGN